MYQMNECDLDQVQDALVRAVLYPFARPIMTVPLRSVPD
jgi:hypothetical protein